MGDFIAYALLQQAKALLKATHTQNFALTSRSSDIPRGYTGGASPKNGSIYVLGGLNGETVYRYNREYNVEANTWTSRPAMPTARHSLGVGSPGNGLVHAIGGRTTRYSGQTNAHEVFDPIASTWSTRAPLPLNAEIQASVSFGDGRIFVLNSNLFNYVYDANSDTWTQLATPSVTWSGYGATNPGNGKIYAAGGVESSVASKRHQCYDPVFNTWTSLPDLPTARAWPAACSIGNLRYSVLEGEPKPGSSGQYGVKDHHEFDVLLNTWTERPQSLYDRYHMTAVAPGDGRFYVIGGVEQYWSVEGETMCGYNLRVDPRSIDDILAPIEGYLSAV